MEIISRLDTHTSIMHGEEIIFNQVHQKQKLKKQELSYLKNRNYPTWRTGTILPGEQKLFYLENRNYPTWRTGTILPGEQEHPTGRKGTILPGEKELSYLENRNYPT